MNPGVHLELERRIEELETAREILEQENKRLRQKEVMMRMNETKLLEVQRIAAIGSWEVDPLTGHLECSERALEYFGTADRDRELEDLFNVVHPEDRERFKKSYEASEIVKQPHEMVHRVVRPGGEVRIVNHYFKTFFGTNGMPLKTIGMIQDVTEQKRTEAELEAARARAVEAVRARSVFLANMTHELPTPMNGIMGMTELALDTELTSEQREYVGTVRASAEALLTVLNDILDFSKIEAGKIELDPINFFLRDSLADMLSALAGHAQSKGVELIYEVQPDVPDALVGDLHRLRQVIINLVSNAIKFTERGEVAVGVERVDATETTVTLHFAVRDTGIGIPEDKLESIFSPFSQADASTTRRYGGTGLGLAISLQLVELLGGRLRAQSAEGEGSTFHFTAGFELGRAARPLTVQTSQEKLEGLPVLIVDDNATNRRVFEQILLNWRMAPQSVASAAEARATLDRKASAGQPFQLVISDINMPEADGFELFEATRSNRQHQGIPFIMLTSASQPGDAARCRQMGVSAHLLKPVKQSVLLNAITKAVIGATATQPQPSTASAAVRSLTRGTLHMLLAEDNAANQMFATRSIEKAGHTVVVVNNGRKAVDRWRQERFDVVLMDVEMPEMDGLQATRRIRELEREAPTNVPTLIVAMTANAMKGDRERCLEAGMDGYVSKPVRRQTLFDEIARLMGE